MSLFWCYFQILKKIGIKENPENGDSVLFRMALLLLSSASTFKCMASLWFSMVGMEMYCNFGTNWAKRCSQVKIQCCQMSKKRSRFVFFFSDSVDLFVLELQVGEKMTENAVNSRLAYTSL